MAIQLSSARKLLACGLRQVAGNRAGAPSEKEEKVRKVVLTGGPCAGKTTCQAAIEAAFGSQVILVPETATLLFEEGYALPGRDCEWSQAWADEFQSVVLARQLELEVAAERLARETGASLLVCDRGRLDSAAYWSGGLTGLVEAFGLDLAVEYGRYDQVLHLESVATACPQAYGNHGNACRSEGLEKAAALELATREAWHGHPNWVFVSGESGVEGKAAKVVAALHSLL